MSVHGPGHPSHPHAAPQEPPRQPQYAPPLPGYQQPQQPVPPATGKLNVLGIIALSIQVLVTISSAFTPTLMFRLSLDLGMAAQSVGLLLAGIHLFWALVVGGLGLGGVLQKQASRLRWTAIGALVAAGLGLLSVVCSLLSSLLTPLFY